MSQLLISLAEVRRVCRCSDWCTGQGTSDLPPQQLKCKAERRAEWAVSAHGVVGLASPSSAWQMCWCSGVRWPQQGGVCHVQASARSSAAQKQKCCHKSVRCAGGGTLHPPQSCVWPQVTVTTEGPTAGLKGGRQQDLFRLRERVEAKLGRPVRFNH